MTTSRKTWSWRTRLLFLLLLFAVVPLLAATPVARPVLGDLLLGPVPCPADASPVDDVVGAAGQTPAAYRR